VSPEDIDDLGHAGNYHYVRWLQHAAVAHSTANGWPPERYDELGAGWVVRSHHIDYLKPAFEGDDLIIRTWVENMKPATSLRRYQIQLQDGTLLARAETDWAFVNYARQRAVRIPAMVAECFTVVQTPAD
jgi:acyl-CoA thioester hydrolase